MAVKPPSRTFYTRPIFATLKRRLKPRTNTYMGTKYKENESQLVLVAGTFDTKGDELTYLADRLKARM